MSECVYSSSSFSFGAVFTCPKQRPHTDQLSGRMEPGGQSLSSRVSSVQPLAEKRLPSGDPSGFQRSSSTSRAFLVYPFLRQSLQAGRDWRSLSSQHSGGRDKKISNTRTARLHNRPCLKKKRANWVWWRSPLMPELWRQRLASLCVRGYPVPSQDIQSYTKKSCSPSPQKRKIRRKFLIIRSSTCFQIPIVKK